MDALLFDISGVRYGLPASHVREIVRAVTIVPLPRSPAIVEGVVNVRGTLVPVLDVRRRFGLPAKPLAHTDHLVLAWAGPRLVAIRADRARDVVQIAERDIDDAHHIVPDAGPLAGVAKLPDGLVLIHDLPTFLEASEAAALDAALHTATVPEPAS
jgi:purine-binding chemotaxis protein CheW